jgi:hypothetical protein
MTSDPATLASPAGTHACVRCGAPTALDRGLCEDCNPLGLRDASSSQVHGTAFVGVLVAVVILAVIARFAVSGIGPFEAMVDSVTADAAGIAVTIRVTNTGSAAGSTTCQLTDRSPLSTGRSTLVQSPRIEPGEAVTFTARTLELGRAVRVVGVECSAP